MSGGGEEETTLKFTPTWVVAALCTVIVSVSLAVERLIHYAGKYLKKNKHKPLYEALLKIKEELMMMGFMSLLLAVPQPHILQICVPANAMRHLLPYSLSSETNIASTNSRRLFGVEGFGAGYCAAENNVPMLSLEALNHLDNFIFVLAIVHVTLSVLTVILGGVKMRQWKHWEESFAQDYYTEMVLKPRFTLVHQHHFIRNRFRGSDMYSVLLSWLHSFGNQIYGSVTKSDYKAMRLGFYMSHCSSNPKFNFYKYMTRVLENDFKKVVGISWYLWIFVVIFLLLNINGWHTYFWIAFIPFILLLAVGTKLEHVISQLAREVAEKHNVVVGELIVQPSDEHFWFNRPHIILYLIHFILFQNAFEMAFFFWIWVQYGFNSCIMGQVRYIVPRLIIGYSTLPLYALVTQMGTHFKPQIFDGQAAARLVRWERMVKRDKWLRAAAVEESTLETIRSGEPFIGSPAA